MADLILKGREKDIGGLIVRRVLPAIGRKHVGPFVFFDHFGPVTVDASHAMDVRAHPHIGLATVTYLFSGRGYHRDSLGSRQVITAGDINWMTAGRGIVHSERTPPEDRVPPAHTVMHGLQVWVALPVDQEECAPSFVHWPKDRIPDFELGKGMTARLLLGRYGQDHSPVKTSSPTLFMDVSAEHDGSHVFSFTDEEIAVYLVDGQIEINGQAADKLTMTFVENTRQIKIKATKGARFVFVGGMPFPEPRHMWWNFVSSRKERIKQAAADWQAQKMGQVIDETDFIPLPSEPLPS